MEQIQISNLEREIDELRYILHQKESELARIKQEFLQTQNTVQNEKQNNVECGSDQLPKWAIVRYSRQILLSEIGVSGQCRLRHARVLVAGAGALACPALSYLAGAGVGEIGIVDYDTVEITNIHRQFLHTEQDENTSKAHSAARKLRSINSTIKVTPYNVQITSENAKQIASNYDIVLDCTDNVPTRYLLNDLCVMLKICSKEDRPKCPTPVPQIQKDESKELMIPLISGSALKMEGQLTIYGYRARNNDKEKDSSYNGPCYRCLFPVPPPAETVGSCSANGVAGPVPGTIGSLQALETIKYIVGHTHEQMLVGRMLIFDGEDITFRTVKLRPRNPKCEVCSANPTITQLIDYEMFCKSDAKEKDLDLKILPENQRITATQLSNYLRNESLKQRHLLVDVRNECEFRMCNIDGSVNYPIDKLYDDKMEDLVTKTKEYDYVTLICRRGNDSQVVCEKLLNYVEKDRKDKIKDLIGGLHAWAKTVDDNFPIY